MAIVLSVNLGKPTPTTHSGVPTTGIDKRPVSHPVLVAAPGRKGIAGSGLAGDSICDRRHHGGDDQAVYAYAREDLDRWGTELGRELTSGSFGENLTTQGIDLSTALIGERWAIGESLILETSDPRIPCRTFAGWLDEKGWIKKFTAWATPGIYLRVLQPGVVQAGDEIRVIHRPDHHVTVSLAFRAFTTESELLPELLPATALSAEARGVVERRTVMTLDVD